MANPQPTRFVSWFSCVGLCDLADYLNNRRRRKETTNMSNSQVLLKDLTWLTQQPRPSRSQEPVSSSVIDASGNKPVQTEEPDIFESPASPYYPPPSTFMPPESPDMHKHQSHALHDSSPAWYNGLPVGRNPPIF